jgi:hypothetical protein
MQWSIPGRIGVPTDEAAEALLSRRGVRRVAPSKFRLVTPAFGAAPRDSKYPRARTRGPGWALTRHPP